MNKFEQSLALKLKQNDQYVSAISEGGQSSFYIGDLCYVLSDDDYDEAVLEENAYDCSHQMERDQTLSVIYDTTFCGDGVYKIVKLSIPKNVSLGKRGLKTIFSVDAGILGCCPVQLIDPNVDMKEVEQLGAILTIPKPNVKLYQYSEIDSANEVKNHFWGWFDDDDNLNYIQVQTD